MAEKSKGKILPIAVILLLVAALFGYKWYVGNSDNQPNIHDTIYVYVTDTVRIIEPMPADTIILTQYIYVVDTVHDTIHGDIPSFVMVPRKQLHYSFRDTADVWVSGYYPKLDSIVWRRQLQTVVVQSVARRNVPVHAGVYVGADAAFSTAGISPMPNMGFYLGCKRLYLTGVFGITLSQKPSLTANMGLRYLIIYK